MTKIAAGKYLQTMTEIASEAEEPLEFRDYISSIHYTTRYNKVIQNDKNKYKDGDISLFDKVYRYKDLKTTPSA